MDPEKLESYIKAGKIAKEIAEESKSLIKEGAKIYDIAETIESKIKERNAEIAFPVNISLNEFAAHCTPKINDETIIKKEDVVKVDIGVAVNGYIADTAYTIDLSGKYEKMLKANEEALNNAIKIIKAGVKISEIGKIIEETIKNSGYKVIENLTGHELDQYTLHAGISIPNISIMDNNKILEEDMVIAIEPFATNGIGRVVETNKIEIFSFIQEKPVRRLDERNFIKEISNRKGLPLAKRWFKNIPESKLNYMLSNLSNLGIIKKYGAFREESRGVVSQFEHTVIVQKDSCIVTTR